MSVHSMFLYFPVLTLCFFTCSLYGMEKEQERDGVLSLSIDNKCYTIPLQDVLTHISAYQYITRDHTEAKILGLHWCALIDPVIEKLEYGTLYKVSPEFWIVTSSSINKFHEGFIIYKGTILSKPKAFFPYHWTLENIIRYVQNLTRTGKICIYKKEQRGHLLIYKLLVTAENKVPLHIIVQCTPSCTSKTMHVLTLYPQVPKSDPVMAHLENLAKRQAQDLSKIEQERQLLPVSDTNTSSNNEQTPLIGAAKSGNWRLVHALLKHNGTFLTHDRGGNTALHYSISSGEILCVLELTNACLINKANKDGITPLAHALGQIFSVKDKEALTRYIEIIKVLLSRGAEVNIQDIYGITPLMQACKCNVTADFIVQGAKTIIELLLVSGANPDIQDTDKNTALMHTIHYNQPLLFNTLLPYSQENLCNAKGETGLVIAKKKQCNDIIKCFNMYSAAKQEWMKEHEAPELLYYAAHQNLLKVKACLSSTPVDTKNTYGYTALYYALKNNDYKIAHLLLDAGADLQRKIQGAPLYTLVQDPISPEIKQLINERVLSLQVPLHKTKNKQLPQLEENLKVIKDQVLLDCLNSESIELCKQLKHVKLNKKGYTIFLYAVQKGKSKAALQILEQIPDIQQENALLIALKAHDCTILEALIKSQRIKEKCIEQCLTLCCESTKDQEDVFCKTITFIKRAYPKIFMQKMYFMAERCVFRLEELLDRKLIILDNAHAGELLHSAVIYKAGSLIEKMIEYYPLCLHYRNSQGQTALMLAAQGEYSIGIKLLYTKGADIHALDTNGKSAHEYAPSKGTTRSLLQYLPLEAAQKENHQKLEEQVSSIREREQGNLVVQGWTPLMVAAYKNNIQALETDTTSVNQVAAQGLTALMIAAYNKSKEACQALLTKQGIEIDKQDHAGYSALMHATQRQCNSIIELLIHAGACPLLMNKNHQTAFNFTSEDKEAYKLLQAGLEKWVKKTGEALAHTKKKKQIEPLLTHWHTTFDRAPLAEHHKAYLLTEISKVLVTQSKQSFADFVQAVYKDKPEVTKVFAQMPEISFLLNNKEANISNYLHLLKLGIKQWLEYMAERITTSEFIEAKKMLLTLHKTINFESLPQENKALFLNHMYKRLEEDTQKNFSIAKLLLKHFGSAQEGKHTRSAHFIDRKKIQLLCFSLLPACSFFLYWLWLNYTLTYEGFLLNSTQETIHFRWTRDLMRNHISALDEPTSKYIATLDESTITHVLHDLLPGHIFVCLTQLLAMKFTGSYKLDYSIGCDGTIYTLAPTHTFNYLVDYLNTSAFPWNYFYRTNGIYGLGQGIYHFYIQFLKFFCDYAIPLQEVKEILPSLEVLSTPSQPTAVCFEITSAHFIAILAGHLALISELFLLNMLLYS